MKQSSFSTSVLLAIVASFVSMTAASATVSVNCNSGQSLNLTLSKLDKHTATTVTVSGTCTEYVQVAGFQGLTLKGVSGATLVQPSTSAGNIFNSVLYIQDSQSVTVDGLNVQASTNLTGIGIGHGSSDVRLRNLSVQGGSESITVFENSQVSIAYVSAKDPAFTTLGIYDLSDVHLEHSAFTDTTGDSWHVGLHVGASHVTMYATSITNMQVGIDAYGGSIIDVLSFDTYYPINGTTDVVIDSPAATNYNGVEVITGGSLNVTGARLVINHAGQTWGGTTGGVLISDNAAMNGANGLLVINKSYGQGLVMLNNAHATISGATITSGGHGGMVLANSSRIDVSSGTALTLVGGNAVDIFCDAGSNVTGSVNMSGVPVAQCGNISPGEIVALP